MMTLRRRWLVVALASGAVLVLVPVVLAVLPHAHDHAGFFYDDHQRETGEATADITIGRGLHGWLAVGDRRFQVEGTYDRTDPGSGRVPELRWFEGHASTEGHWLRANFFWSPQQDVFYVKLIRANGDGFAVFTGPHEVMAEYKESAMRTRDDFQMVSSVWLAPG